jgi:hypothetical protein
LLIRPSCYDRAAGEMGSSGGTAGITRVPDSAELK